MTNLHNADSFAHLTTKAVEELGAKHSARERCFQISREVIRMAANAIRGMHRKEFQEAESLLQAAETRLKDASDTLEHWPEIYYAGFLADARKEYSEARVTLALMQGLQVPMPWDIGVEMAPYLNGLGEAIGELRRFVLDTLRNGDPTQCEAIIDDMEDIYEVLVSIDFPDTITGGLRRTADSMRVIMERTRGDLTLALTQFDLTRRMDHWELKFGTD